MEAEITENNYSGYGGSAWEKEYENAIYSQPIYPTERERFDWNRALYAWRHRYYDTRQEIIEKGMEYHRLNPDLLDSLQSIYLPDSEGYNNSFIGIVLNALAFVNIPYSKVSVEEMQKCLDVVAKRLEALSDFNPSYVNPVKHLIDKTIKEVEDYYYSIRDNTFHNIEYFPEDTFEKFWDHYYHITNTLTFILEYREYYEYKKDLDEGIEALRAECRALNKKYVWSKGECYPHRWICPDFFELVSDCMIFAQKIEDGYYDGLIDFDGQKAASIFPDTFGKVVSCARFYLTLREYLRIFITLLKVVESPIPIDPSYYTFRSNIKQYNAYLASNMKLERINGKNDANKLVS